MSRIQRVTVDRHGERRRRINRATSRSGEVGRPMGSSKQQPLPPMELNRVQGPSQTNPNNIQDWRALVPRALGRAGISQKHAAADLGITPGLFSAQLSGRDGDHLSLWRMHELPRPFWQELVLLIIDFYDLQIGLSEIDRRDMETGRALRELVTRSVAR